MAKENARQFVNTNHIEGLPFIGCKLTRPERRELISRIEMLVFEACNRAGEHFAKMAEGPNDEPTAISEAIREFCL
jgi:hypothetical protein